MWIIYGCNPLSFNFHITILRCVGFSYDFLYFSCSCVVVFLFVLSFATQSGIVSIVHNVGFTTSYCTLFCTNRRASFYHFSLEAQEPHSVLSRFKAIWFNVCVHLGLFFFCCAMLSCCLQLVFVVCFFFVLWFIIEYSCASFSFFRRLKSEFYAVASSSIFLRLYPSLFILCYFLEFFNVSFCFHITCGFCFCPLRSGFFFLYYCCCFSLHLRSVCDYMGGKSIEKKACVYVRKSLCAGFIIELQQSDFLFAHKLLTQNINCLHSEITAQTVNRMEFYFCCKVFFFKKETFSVR